jgi:putative flippase GtrA
LFLYPTGAMMKNKAQFLKYILTGSCAALTQLIILWLGVSIFGLPEILSSGGAFFVAIIVNYTLQHKIVFNKNGDHHIFFKRYFFLTLIMQMVNIGLFWVFINLIGIQYLIAQVIVIGIIFMCNYFINSQYTFKN